MKVKERLQGSFKGSCGISSVSSAFSGAASSVRRRNRPPCSHSPAVWRALSLFASPPANRPRGMERLPLAKIPRVHKDDAPWSPHILDLAFWLDIELQMNSKQKTWVCQCCITKREPVSFNVYGIANVEHHLRDIHKLDVSLPYRPRLWVSSNLSLSLLTIHGFFELFAKNHYARHRNRST